MESYLLGHQPRSQPKRNRKTLRRARRTTRGRATWFSWCKILQPCASWTNRFCGFGRLGFVLGQRVTRLELATSSLARRCSTTELHPRFEREEIMSIGRRDATFLIAPQSGIFE